MSDAVARPRLLIVDDDPAICQLIADIANVFDYQTDIASTPDEIDQFLGGGHDLVMLDLSLGETDGMRVMRDLGERQPGANLVLLTGADTSVLQGAARVAELSGFHLVGACGKPASIQELEAVLRPQQHEPKPVAAVDDLRTTVLRALDDGALYLLYQPIVDLRTGLVCRVEALVRLDVPGANQISPEKWVPIIEAEGRSIDLLEVVLRHAAFDRASVPALAALDNISINLSVLDLAHLDLPERAESILGAAASPERWTLEITETAEVGKLADALDVLIRLRLKGFWLDMDDFGSGSSTLHRLRELPFTGVKADRPVLVMPEDRGWDASTLGGVLKAWDKFDGQVVIGTTTKPKTVPAGWCVIDLAKAEKAEEVEEAPVVVAPVVEVVTGYKPSPAMGAMLKALGYPDAAVASLDAEKASHIVANGLVFGGVK
jgi:EAL domain-containing protein (putative c-di-GMP-specific phosphodiesterase class I)/ActR/RegA family two-component response regulator